MSRARIIADLSGGFGIDSGALSFGTDKEITLTHDPDDGLILKHAATADDSFPELTFQTGDTDIAVNDLLGRINFQAPDEGAGTDAILVAGAIAAISEGDFSASANATSLIFQTGASETATTKMTLSSGGNLTVTGNVSVGGDLDVTGSLDMSDANLTNVGSIQLDSIAGDADSNTSITFSGSDVITFATNGNTAITLNASQILTLSGNMIIPDGAQIGSASDTDALAISSGGVLTLSATTASTNATSGALVVGGGAGIAADLSVGDDVRLISDAAVLSFGADSEVTLTHVADTGILLNSTNKLQFNDASQFIHAPSATVLDIAATDEIELTATLIDVRGNLAVSGNLNLAGNLEVVGTSSTTVTASGAVVPDANDGATIGTAALAFADLFLADGATIQLGNDEEITITHVADTGILFNTTSVIQFRDSAINIGSPADGDLDINADDEIELNSTLIDINGNVEISGTLAQVGVATFTARDIHSGGITIANDGQIGSVGDADSIAISSAGVTTFSQKDVHSIGMSVKNGATSAGFVEFFEDSDNGSNKVTLIGPASTADVTVTLPNSAGTIATTATAADEATALAIALG